MYGISIDYKLCNQAANDLNNIAREMSQEISYINSAKAELSSLSREYRSPNSEIEALIRLNRKLNEERQKVSLLSREIQKHVNNMRDFDDRLAKKISKNYKREIVRKFQFPSNPKDDYRVIGGTYLYPNRNVNEKIHIDPEIERYKKLLNPNYSSDFLNYFLERRIENEKNINRIKAIEASKYKYEINVRDIHRSIYSFNFTNVGGMYLEYLYNRTIGYFGEMNAENLKLRGMEPKLADLGGDFMSGMLFESALTIGISGLKYINYGKNSTVGSGLGNLEKANSKPVKKLEKIDDSLLKNLDDLNEIGNDIKGVRQPVSVSANEIRFSQSSVNGADEIISSMKANGWKGDPIDVIKMSDGKLTTIDNTRVVAAREAGIDAQAIIHDANELLPENLIDRFTTKKGVPKTWGEAIELRIGKQKASFRNNNPFGADTMERIGK